MSLHDILLLGVGGGGLALVVVEVVAILRDQYLGRVVEEDTCAGVRQQITQSVFRRVVYPLLYPHIRLKNLLGINRLHFWIAG